MSATETMQQQATEEKEQATMTQPTPELERKGKDTAATFLERRGYTIRERDYEAAGHQVDIIAQDGENGPLVFAPVAVSTRGFAEEYNPRVLRKQFEAVAPMWLAENPDVVDVPLRCDVIYMDVVSPSRAMIKHHVDAIGHVEPSFQEKFLAKASEKTGIDEGALAEWAQNHLTIATV